MTSPLIERVARALADLAKDCWPCGGDRCCCSQGVEALECRTRLDIEDFARAAIEAMREPSEEMKLAGSIDPGFGGPDDGYETEVWHAMIDAALKGEG